MSLFYIIGSRHLDVFTDAIATGILRKKQH